MIIMKADHITTKALRSIILEKKKIELQTSSVRETHDLAGRIANLFVDKIKEPLSVNESWCNVIALIGNLGAGKTTFVQGFCAALGVKTRPTSPTFTLMHVYETDKVTVNHFDFYRLKSSAEIEALGCEEYFDDNACISIVEWPELAWPLMPSYPLSIKLTMPDFTKEPEIRQVEIKTNLIQR